MLTTEAIIMSVDLNSNRCSVRVPLFENFNTGAQAIMDARLTVQPGSFNNYKQGDFVWVTFINGTVETALILGKIYRGPEDENKNSGGNLNINSLQVSGGTAKLPAATLFSVSSEEYNSIEKIINKIKDLEIKNVFLEDKIADLQYQIDLMNKLFGEDIIRDSEGTMLADSDGQTLQYAKNNT